LSLAASILNKYDTLTDVFSRENQVFTLSQGYTESSNGPFQIVYKNYTDVKVFDARSGQAVIEFRAFDKWGYAGAVGNDGYLYLVGGSLNGPYLEKRTLDGVLVGEIVTRILHNEGYKNHELEYEKTLYPMIIVKKKTYAGVYYEWSNSKPYVLNMGLVTKKRGFSNILKKIYSKVLDYLLWEFSPESAIEYVSNCVKNINTFNRVTSRF
jgi:hypothetical protein